MLTPAKQRNHLRYGVKRHGLKLTAAAVGISPHGLAAFIAGEAPRSDQTRRALERASKLRFDSDEIYVPGEPSRHGPPLRLVPSAGPEPVGAALGRVFEDLSSAVQEREGEP